MTYKQFKKAYIAHYTKMHASKPREIGEKAYAKQWAKCSQKIAMLCEKHPEHAKQFEVESA